MNRLEKHCVIASSAFHGLLAVVAVFGAALTPKPEQPPLQHFTLVGLPTDLQTTADASVADTTVAAVATAQTATQASRPVLSRDELQRVSRNNQAPNPTSARRPVNDPRVKNAFADAVHNIANGASASGAVSIASVGGDGPAMANYGDLVYSRYRAAWIPPLGLEDDSISVTANITVSRDGQVIQHEITKRSGNSAMDNSIASTLENVTFIDAFPPGTTDTQRTFTIKFTPKAGQP